MITKTISTKGMLAKVYNDFKPSGSHWVSGAVDWIADAMGLIGYHAGLETKTCTIKIKNFRGCFPDEMETLIGVIYNGRKLPLAMSKTKFPVTINKDAVKSMLSEHEQLELVKLQKQIEDLTNYLAVDPDNTDYIDAKSRALAQFNSLSESKYVVNNIGYDYDYYSINPDYIITSFEEGEVTLIMECFIIDSEGFPRIPDRPKYKDAVLWYIIRTMILSGYKHPEFGFREADAIWEDKRRKAANDVKISSLDQKQRATNLATRVRFTRELGDNFFIGGEGQFNEM